MHHALTPALALAAAAPLTLLALAQAPSAAAATSASATAATAATAASAVITCDGSHTATFNPGLSDTPQPETGTAVYELGTDNDLLGLVGGSDCTSPDGSRTAAAYPGAIMTVHFTENASCDSAAFPVNTGGTIRWNNDQTSVLGKAPVPIDEFDRGNGIVELSMPITSGPFAGKKAVVQVNADTGHPNACDTSGVQDLDGTAALSIQ